MNIAVIKESAPDERRVALVPGDLPALIALGAAVVVERGAGVDAGFTDEEYRDKGAQVLDRGDALARADIFCAVRVARAARSVGAAHDLPSDGAQRSDDSGSADVLSNLPEGATVVALLDPYGAHPDFSVMARRRHTAFSLERIPRITRAQSMDVLSSQANLAGYRAVLLGALELPKIFPMMMTAAGTVVPARVFVLGVGVAGLQAIATAKRLGAVVSAYDIRPAVEDQVKSLGARFVHIDVKADDAETGGGYAREMDEAFYRKQREKMLEVVAESDVVITTASIPGKRAPILVTDEMVEAMRPGTVVVDLAAERGGNCTLTEAGRTVDHHGVRILGPVNVASGSAHHASQLFSRNITTFLKEIVHDGKQVMNRDDEIVAATLVMQDGTAADGELAAALGVGGPDVGAASDEGDATPGGEPGGEAGAVHTEGSSHTQEGER